MVAQHRAWPYLVAVLVLIVVHHASASCTSSVSDGPIVPNAGAERAVAISTGSFAVAFRSTTTFIYAVYTFVASSRTTTLLAGNLTLPSGGQSKDGVGANAVLLSVSAIAYGATSAKIYFVDLDRLRTISLSGVVTTIYQNAGLSASSELAIAEQGATLYLSFGACVYSGPATSSPLDLQLSLGNCNESRTTVISGSIAPNAPIPTVTMIAFPNTFSNNVVVYFSRSVQQFFLHDVSKGLVGQAATIGADAVSAFSPASTYVAYFSNTDCYVGYMQVSGAVPTASIILVGGREPAACNTGILAGTGSGSTWVQLRSAGAGGVVTLTGCPIDGASTTEAPSSSSSNESDTTIIIIVVVVIAAVAIVFIAVVVFAVLKLSRPAARMVSSEPNNTEPYATEMRATDSTEKSSGTPAMSGSVLPLQIDRDVDVRAAEVPRDGDTGSTATTSTQLRNRGIEPAARSPPIDSYSTASVVQDPERFSKRCSAVAAGAYQKGRILGRGANGTVYAVLLKDGSTIAMKEVNLMGSEDEIRAQMRDVEREAALLRDLHHPNLVTYYDVQSDYLSMQIRLFMENVTGGSLGSMVRSMDERLDEQTARVLTQQIVKGLAFIHSRGIVHRDLKPDNILRDSHTGLVKLADFGTAKSLGNAAGASKAAQTMIGTPYFMAPEILLSGMGELDVAGYGTKADVWSLGITVAELLNRGVPPWPQFSGPGQAFLHISSPQGIPTMPDGLSAECQDFIRRCTDRNPATRPTANELLLHEWFLHGTEDVSME